jgi:hypothetical protein
MKTTGRGHTGLGGETTRVGLLTLALLFATFGSLEAQRGGARRGGGQDRAVLEQRMRAQMGRVIRERLGLDEDQARRLGEVTQSFDERRRELGRSEQAVRNRVQALMLEGGEDEAEARELLARLVELRRAEVSLFEEEQAALAEVLSSAQILQLHALREQVGQRIRALRGRGGEGGMRPPRGNAPARPRGAGASGQFGFGR